MKRQVGLVKDFHRDGRGILPGLGPEYVHPKETLADVAIETVAYTYLLRHLAHDVMQVDDISTRDSKRTAIKTKVTKEHRVALTEETISGFSALSRGKVPEGMSLHGVPAALMQAYLSPFPPSKKGKINLT